MIEALYIHIPFCKARCAYCDFRTSACSDDALMDSYVDALSLAVRRASRAGLFGSLKTIYIGGGTPSYLGARRLSSLIYLLSLSINLENVEEFTVECNPDSLDERMVNDLYALGVNRFSIGAQSFDDEELRLLGRVHDAAAIERAVQALKGRDVAFSLDLICGLPNQTLENWKHSLDAALALGPDHVSVYPLQLEEGTPLAARVDAGELPSPDENLQADMMEYAADALTNAGLHRYEVASYAREGAESKHNMAYWTGVEYLGLGAGAAGMLAPSTAQACIDAGLIDAYEQPGSDVARVRLQNTQTADEYAREQGRAVCETEFLTAAEALAEDLMLAARRSVGLSPALIARACETFPDARATFDHLVERGLLVDDSGHLEPTDSGWLSGNVLYGELWDLASRG